MLTSFFRKSDGSYMILPHYLAEFISGKIKLSNEYSGFRWVRIKELKNFEPKIANIPETIVNLLKIKPMMEKDFKII